MARPAGIPMSPIQPRINERPSRLRDRLMPADANMACRKGDGPAVFAAVIEYYAPTTVKMAKAICADCPVIEACLSVHGRDFELGVVAGKTDRERRNHYKATA